MDIDYLFMSIRDFADLIVKIYTELNPETEISFSFSSEEDVKFAGEATGWYGITKVHLFDFDSVVIGYWGGGAIEIMEIDDSFEQEEVQRRLVYLGEYEISNFDTSYVLSVDKSSLPEGWEELR